MISGQDIVQLENQELDKARSKIGFLFQGNAIYDSMTIRENLEFPLRRRWFRLKQDEIDARVEEALDSVGLKHTVELMPSE